MDDIKEDDSAFDIPDTLPAWTGSSVQVSEWAIVVGKQINSMILINSSFTQSTHSNIRQKLNERFKEFDSVIMFLCFFNCIF